MSTTTAQTVQAVSGDILVTVFMLALLVFFYKIITH